MPFQAKQTSHEATATKAVLHGDPCIEDGFPGIAFKSKQMSGTSPSSAALTAARTVEIGEQFIIKIGGLVRIRAALLPGGTTSGEDVGDALYITAADNAISETASMNVFFGRIERKDSSFVYVNTDVRA